MNAERFTWTLTDGRDYCTGLNIRFYTEEWYLSIEINIIFFGFELNLFKRKREYTEYNPA